MPLKKILFIWDYGRTDLTEYLLQFTDELELVFLSQHLPAEVPVYLRHKNISVVYWNNFSSPYQILKSVKPDKLVFADIESFNQVALNIAAKNLGIRTYVLQHGLRGAFEVEESLSNGDVPTPIQINRTTGWSVRFFLRSLRFKNLKYWRSLVRFLYVRKTNELTVALTKCQFDLRVADYYIEFSENNKGYFKARDNIKDYQFFLVGNPMVDDYFRYFNNINLRKVGDYYLLIDCPFTEAGFLTDTGITEEKKAYYLTKLATVARLHGKKLKVKLHPASYGNLELPNDDNIEYLERVDLLELIAGADSIFFVHFSSLVPVVLAYKPAIYFNAGLPQHTQMFSELKVKTYDLFEFSPENVRIEKDSLINVQNLIPFLYSVDGKAASRVKEVLKC